VRADPAHTEAGKSAEAPAEERRAAPHYRRPNQKEYTIRLQQFFDRFLKGAPEKRPRTEGGYALPRQCRTGLEVESDFAQLGQRFRTVLPGMLRSDGIRQVGVIESPPLVRL
jgi:hypothetical protein